LESGLKTLDNREPKSVYKKEGFNPHKERAPNRAKRGVFNLHSEFLFINKIFIFKNLNT